MKITNLLLFAALATIAGCGSEGIERPPPTDIRVFHAANSYDVVAFLREERVEAQLEFATGSTKTFDSGPYDFHVDYINGATGGRVRALEFAETLSPDIDYLFVLVVENGELKSLVVETDDLEPSETTSRYHFVHAHPDLGPFDVYAVDIATVTNCELAGSSPVGSASYGATPIDFELAPAGYRLCLTAPGDPSTVIYQSDPIPLQVVGREFHFIAYDTSDYSTNGLTVSIQETTALQLTPANVGPQLRVLQSVDDGLARDIFRNDDVAPLYPAPLDAGVLSDYVTLPNGISNIHLVPPGGGDPEATIVLNPIPGRFFTTIFAGDTTNGILATLMAEDARPITGQATLRIIQAAGMHDAIQVYLRPPGTDITNLVPNASFSSAPGVTPKLTFPPGEFEITVVDTNTRAVLAGPVPVSFAAAGVYGISVINNPLDAATVTLDYFYDLAP